jgi:hypothetical protein
MDPRDEARIELAFRQSVEAAEEMARIAWPDVPGLREDLRARTFTEADFAAQHRDWFMSRWPIEDLDEWDWNAIDPNPWSNLQDCLGIRGLMIVVEEGASAEEVRRQLSASAMSCATELQNPKLASIGDGREFLHELATLQEVNSEVILVEFCEYCNEGTVVSCLPKAHLPELERLALIADIYKEGIRRL